MPNCKHRYHLLYSRPAIVVLMLSLCSLSYGQNQGKVYREQTSQIERIKVIGLRGSVKLMAQPDAAQAVVKIAHHKGSSEEWHESVRRDGTTLVIEIQAPVGHSSWTAQEQKNWPQYDIEIQAHAVPSEIYWRSGETTVTGWRAAVTMTQQAGKMVVHGGEGESHLTLQEGKLSLSERHGRTFIDCFNVDLNLQNIEGDVQLDNFAGKSQLTELNGQLQLRAGSGALTLNHAHGSLEYRVEKGALTVGDFTGPVRGTSETANVHVAVEDPVDVRLKAQDGHLTVGLPQGSGANVNIETKEGELILPRTINVKRGENDRVAMGDIPGSGHGSIYIRTETASVHVK
jgi:hypothetical protein